MLYSSKQINLVRETINQWLRLSILIGLGVCVIYFLLWSFLPISISPSQYTFYLIYSVAILAQLVLQLIVLTYHSGAFSIRRIARSMLSISGSDIIGLLILLALWPITHLYSLPISLVATQFFRLFMTYTFTKRTYLLLGLKKIQLSKQIKDSTAFRSCLSREGLLAGLSNLIMRAEGLILILLFAFSANKSSEHLLFFLFFYLISPFTKYSYDWVRLFYYDFKKLDRPLFQQFSKRLVIITRKHGPLIGFIFWIPVLIICQFFDHANLKILLILCLFFIFRPIISIYQMQAFSEHRYWDTIISGILSIAPLIIAVDSHWNIELKLVILTLSLVMAIIYLHTINTRPVKTYLIDKVSLPFFEWIRLLSLYESMKQPRTIYQFTFSHYVSQNQLSQLASLISTHVGDQADMSQLNNNVYLLQVNKNYMIDYNWMNQISAGQIYDIKEISMKEIILGDRISQKKLTKLITKYRKNTMIHWVSLEDPCNLPPDIDCFEIQAAVHKITTNPLKLIKIGKYRMTITVSERGIEHIVFIDTLKMKSDKVLTIQNVIFQQNMNVIKKSFN